MRYRRNITGTENLRKAVSNALNYSGRLLTTREIADIIFGFGLRVDTTEVRAGLGNKGIKPESLGIDPKEFIGCSDCKNFYKAGDIKIYLNQLNDRGRINIPVDDTSLDEIINGNLDSAETAPKREKEPLRQHGDSLKRLGRHPADDEANPLLSSEEYS